MATKQQILSRSTKMIVTTLLAALSFSQTAPSPDFSLWANERIVETHYVWGGIDDSSYVYWPTKAPDYEPLRLVKAGQRAKAFDYCISKLETTKGDLRFFYSIQATTLGFGLYKSHIVIQKLMPEFEASARKALKLGKFEPDVSTADLLALRFAQVISGYLGTEERKSAKYAPVEQTLNAPNVFSGIVGPMLKKRSLTKLEHRAIAALMSFHDPADNWEEAPANWKQFMDSVPEKPEFFMVYRKLLSLRNATKTYTQVRLNAHKVAAEYALKLDPNYDRAQYSVGSIISMTDTVRAERLIRAYLALGTGPDYEVARARALLDWLEKVNRKK